MTEMSVTPGVPPASAVSLSRSSRWVRRTILGEVGDIKFRGKNWRGRDHGAILVRTVRLRPIRENRERLGGLDPPLLRFGGAHLPWGSAREDPRRARGGLLLGGNAG